jgi:hypothetical protein
MASAHVGGEVLLGVHGHEVSNIGERDPTNGKAALRRLAWRQSTARSASAWDEQIGRVVDHKIGQAGLVC